MNLNTARFMNPSAIELWSRHIYPEDRVLITGASGWFGRTASYLMSNIPVRTKFYASKNRTIDLPGFTYNVETWDLDSAREFEPTVVIDTAFVTREQISRYGFDSYVELNRNLTSQLIALAKLSSVRKIMTISSGAAVTLENESLFENPYGVLKREAEQQLFEAREDIGERASIARAWSVSGGFVQQPMNYAFSNLILQAQEGNINIFSPSAVYRKYCSVEELLAVSLAQDTTSAHAIIDSGGVLVEIAELANRIAKFVNPNSEIIRSDFAAVEANNYFSQSDEWDFQTSKLGLQCLSLQDQIIKTTNGLNFIR